MNKILLFIFIFFSFHVYSQNERKIWHFGPQSTGMLFDVNNNITIANIFYTPFTNCGATMVTHPVNGNLMFYTDGKVVIDTNHDPMPNGSGLNGGNATHSSGLAVPDPSDCNKYFVFTITTATESFTTGNLYYSKVDLNLPGNGTMSSPLGDVITGQKNILLTNNVAEALQAVPKTNSHDYWLIGANNSNSSLNLYLVNATGVNFVSTFPIGIPMEDMQAMKYSSVSGKLFVGSFRESDPCLLIDFNAATGIFSNVQQIPGTPFGTSLNTFAGIVDAEWSVDGTKLYISKFRQVSPNPGGGKLYQYDLNLPLNAPQLIYNVSSSNNGHNSKGLRRGPDNKIYYCYNNSFNGDIFLGVINDPDLPGMSCNFVNNQVNFITSYGFGALLPLFPEYPNSLPSLEDSIINYSDNVCSPGFDTLNINLSSILSDNENDNISFTLLPGTAGNISVSGNTIDYSAVNGITSDTITVSYCDDYCFALCDTFRIILSISSSGNGFSLNLPPVMDACEGEIVSLDAGISGAVYNWSTGEITQQINVSVSGNYFVEVTSNGCNAYDTVSVLFYQNPVIPFSDTSSCSPVTFINNDPSTDYTWNTILTDTFTVGNSSQIIIEAENNFGCISTDTIDVIINPNPQPDLGNDTIFCPDNFFNITYYAQGYNSVLWSDNSNGDSINVNTVGIYFVTVTDINGCTGSDTVSVGLYTVNNVNLGPDRESCSFVLSSNITGNNYLWSTGSTSSSVTADTTGFYWLTVIDANGCSDTDSVYLDIIESNGFFGFIPNVFSPNGDGINDEFRISGISDMCSDELHVEIYNRWGQLLFVSDDPEFKWDGKFENETTPDGVYFVLFRGSFGAVNISGNYTVSIFR